jgi:hypothetical protein
MSDPSQQRAVFSVRKYVGWIIPFAIAAAAIIFWQATSKISGGVSVVIADAAAVALPGAHVALYKLTEDQQRLLLTKLNELKQANDQAKSQNARVFPAQSSDERTRSDLAGYNNLSDTKHCFALEKVMDEIRGFAIRKQATDSQGRFAFHVLPGQYLLDIVGQGGHHYFEFIEPVDLKWRVNLKLADPSCQYSMAE